MEEPHPVGSDGDLRNLSTQINPVVIDKLFTDLIKYPIRDSISNQMLSMEAYEMAVGLQKGDGSEVPVSLVTMKEQRDYIKDSEWERTIRVLIKVKLMEITQMSLMELLELPHHLLVSIYEIAGQVSREEPDLLKKMTNEMKNNK